MVKRRVMVFPCGSEIGLEIYRALSTAKEVELFGASSVEDHGKYVYSNYFGGLPFTEDNSFPSELNRIINDHKIDYIFPAHDSTLLRLAEEQANGGIACPVLCSPVETCRLCRSKKATLDLFRGLLPTPHVFNSLNEVIEFPVFLKPDVGQGSKGTVLAKSAEECRFYLKRDPSLLVLENLPGTEYTVDCFTDRDGKLVFAGGRERVRIMNGISVTSRPVHNPLFTEYARLINQKLQLRGVWFYQVKLNTSGEPALMEIAPRIAGAMGMHRALGVNFALMSIYDAEGFSVKPLLNNFDVRLDSALNSRCYFEIRYEHVYIDFDDCLIMDDTVNTEAVKFLYQCINRGIGLHLLTRHAGNLELTLARHRLTGLFDSVTLLTQGQLKSNAIKHSESIFIDDSFAERCDVQESLGIPVFAPDVIASLLF